MNDTLQEELDLMACSLAAVFDAREFRAFTYLVFQLMRQGNLSPEDLDRLEQALDGAPDGRFLFDGELMHTEDEIMHPCLYANCLPGDGQEMHRKELLARANELQARNMPLPDDVRRVAENEDRLRVRHGVPFVSDAISEQIREGIRTLRLTYGVVLRRILEFVETQESVQLQQSAAFRNEVRHSSISA
ncbi:MAG: hypothetical protein PHZ00_06870 [Candidatus Peribacteraceae bacterium]|nr:hypothetical protein [Candidatus Peribacteraceae bacterium]